MSRIKCPPILKYMHMLNKQGTTLMLTTGITAVVTNLTLWFPQKMTTIKERLSRHMKYWTSLMFDEAASQ